MRSITDLTPNMDAGPKMNKEVSDRLMRVFPDRAGVVANRLGGEQIRELHDDTLSKPDWQFAAALDDALTDYEGLPSVHNRSDPASSKSRSCFAWQRPRKDIQSTPRLANHACGVPFDQFSLRPGKVYGRWRPIEKS